MANEFIEKDNYHDKFDVKHLVFTVIVGLLSISINVFIIIQASLDGVSSTESSSHIVNFLKTIINTFAHDAINESNIDAFSGIIRKLVGHFGLFLVSALLFSWWVYLMRIYIKFFERYIGLIISLVFGLTLASLTELIQIYTPGRSGELRDILIDYSGYIIGTGIILLIIFIIYKVKEKKETKMDV